jgi:xanthine/uracil permease
MIVHFAGYRWVERLMPPVVTGAIVAAIGLVLAPIAINSASACLCRSGWSAGDEQKAVEICIDGLSFWLMRIVREIGRGTSVQAVWE